MSFLFIVALKSSDIYPGNEGTQEAKSIQVTDCSLLRKSEYLRQIIELVDIDLPCELVASKSNATW